jgi:serine/threonine protein phosphatase 1
MNLRPAPARLPPGRRVYAVGDIHGVPDRLAALHAAILEDLARRPVAAPLLVHLGDYIDKGPDGAGVLALMTGRPPALPMVNLLGNHERMMLDALAGDAAAAADWLWCGGRATLASYGLDADAPRSWAAGVPEAHLRFLRGLALSHREGGYLFVHAGLRPGVALEAQRAEDMLGIRQPFLASEAAFGAVVVHGHTARAEPELRANRIGLDTAAWSGGPLTCAVLEAATVGFLAA